jgi:hypothetical protein
MTFSKSLLILLVNLLLFLAAFYFASWANWPAAVSAAAAYWLMTHVPVMRK